MSAAEHIAIQEATATMQTVSTILLRQYIQQPAERMSDLHSASFRLKQQEIQDATTSYTSTMEHQLRHLY